MNHRPKTMFPSDESLNDFPKAFQEREPMPWEREPSPLVWQWGLDAGKELREIASRELVRKRTWLERKNGNGAYFQKLIDEIDRVLTERGGEL